MRHDGAGASGQWKTAKRRHLSNELDRAGDGWCWDQGERAREDTGSLGWWAGKAGLVPVPQLPAAGSVAPFLSRSAEAVIKQGGLSGLQVQSKEATATMAFLLSESHVGTGLTQQEKRHIRVSLEA